MAKPAPIVFVVRASIRDGLGHLVRSLSVLRELQHLHPVHLFILGDGAGRHLIEAAAIPFTPCSSDKLVAESALMRQAVLVVFDTLRLEAEAFVSIAAVATTVSLSPVFDQMEKVDHLFHRTVTEDPAWPRSGPFPQVHKGLRYAVLPAWLKRVRTGHYLNQVKEERLAVAISMGGTDAPNRTLSLLKLLGQCPERLVLFVALGDAYRHSYDELLQCAAANRQEIILLKSNESMWRVLQSVSLIVCAGGLTTYEAAYIGIPSINILQSAGWSWLFEELVESGACLTLSPNEHSLQQAVESVRHLEKNRQELLRMHKCTQRLIPSGGARRIARALQLLGATTQRTPQKAQAQLIN